MSKFDEAMEKYKKHLGEIDSSADHDLLERIAKGLGPSIYNNDASKVSCSDQSELDRVAKNYCEKKLGVEDKDASMKAIAAACGKYDSRTKYRAVFYYLVCKELKKESVYA